MRNLTDEDLESLDRLEGYPNHCDRFVAQIDTDKGIPDS